MPDAVEVIFQIDQPGTAAAKLKTLDQLTDEIGNTAKAAGLKLDRDLVASFAKMSPAALTQINAEMLKMVPATNAATAAVQRLAGATAAVQPPAAGGGGPVQGPRSFGQRAQDLDFEKVLNRSDPAAKKLAATMQTVEAHSTKGAHAMQQIKNALLGIAGVPHLQAVESLTQIGGAAMLGPVALIAGLAIGLMKVKEIFDGIREEAEATLKAVEKWGNLGKMGMRGGTEDSKKDFENLRDAAAEMKKLGNLGMTREMADVSEKMLGVKGLTLQAIEARLAISKARFESLGGDTRDQVMVQKLKDQETLHQKQITDFNQLKELQLQQQISDMDAAVKLRAKVTEAKADLIKFSMDSFQAAAGRAQKLGALFDEQEKLRGGLGGADVRSKATGIEAQADVLKKAITEAMLEGREFGSGGRRDLLSQLDSLGLVSPADRLASEASARGLQRGQDALGAAGSDTLKQGFALDAILAATSNIGGLSSDQVDQRMKALDQKMGIDQENAQKAEKNEQAWEKFRENVVKALVKQQEGTQIEVVLKDDSRGAMSATIDDMGKTPTKFDPMSGSY